MMLQGWSYNINSKKWNIIGKNCNATFKVVLIWRLSCNPRKIIQEVVLLQEQNLAIFKEIKLQEKSCNITKNIIILQEESHNIIRSYYKF